MEIEWWILTKVRVNAVRVSVELRPEDTGEVPPWLLQGGRLEMAIDLDSGRISPWPSEDPGELQFRVPIIGHARSELLEDGTRVAWRMSLPPFMLDDDGALRMNVDEEGVIVDWDARPDEGGRLVLVRGHAMTLPSRFEHGEQLWAALEYLTTIGWIARPYPDGVLMRVWLWTDEFPPPWVSGSCRWVRRRHPDAACRADRWAAPLYDMEDNATAGALLGLLRESTGRGSLLTLADLRTGVFTAGVGYGVKPHAEVAWVTDRGWRSIVVPVPYVGVAAAEALIRIAREEAAARRETLPTPPWRKEGT